MMSHTESLSVLVADDIGGSRQLLGSLLRRLAPGVRIAEVADGACVTELHRSLLPDITFLDIGLPNKNGLEVLREIRALDTRAFVVIVSGQGRGETIAEALALRVDGYVVKPYSPRRIEEALARCRARLKGAAEATAAR